MALIVVIVVAAILIPIGMRTEYRDLLLNESGRMRKVYVALAFYEEQYDSMPAPSLVPASTYDPNRLDFLSEHDPFKPAGNAAASSEFPSDPGLDNQELSPFRISFSYVENYLRAKKLAMKPWSEARLDPSIGELANEWLGSVQPGDNFHAQVAGRILRIATDGHVFVLNNRGGPKPLGDAQDLFTRQR